MKNFIGITCIILGLAIAIFGSIAITIFVIYDIIMNFDSLTAGDIFWDIVWLVCRDIISVIIGVGLYAFGMHKLSS